MADEQFSMLPSVVSLSYLSRLSIVLSGPSPTLESLKTVDIDELCDMDGSTGVSS